MVIPEDSDNITSALNRIADGLEENNEVLNRILSHYDGVVPVMTRNAKRAEALADEQEKQGEFGWGDYLNPKKVFRPQEN